MGSVLHGNQNCSAFCKSGGVSFVGISALPILRRPNSLTFQLGGTCPSLNVSNGMILKRFSTIPKCTSTDSNGKEDDATKPAKVPFGYSRKDVLLIGVGVTAIGIGLKSGLEYFGVDPLQAGNVVQLVLVLGLTVGWISTYIFRVSNKEMTYAQQLRDYEDKVMQKRLEGLSEAEIEALLEQVEEEKRRLASGEQVN